MYHTMADSSKQRTAYLTTRPVIPPTSTRTTKSTVTATNVPLELRPFQTSDLPHAYRLRTQEAVMVNTSTGRIDADLAASQTWIDRFLPPNDLTTYNTMVWAQTGREWEHIGTIGAHITSPVAHIGYMFRTEWWGKGVATAALKLFVQMWWDLERKDVLMDFDKAKDEHERRFMDLESRDGGDRVTEILLGEVVDGNIASKKALQRCGFVYVDSEEIMENGSKLLILDLILPRPD